ncbi:hypothetical protein ABIB38_004800, partial [Massilia sp. UYP11]|uniref:hypothetical protein n=1 Tax=Massilia sp. UYP11 TaxID=1756385 RepID=UPI003D19339B
SSACARFAQQSRLHICDPTASNRNELLLSLPIFLACPVSNIAIYYIETLLPSGIGCAFNRYRSFASELLSGT